MGMEMRMRVGMGMGMGMERFVMKVGIKVTRICKQFGRVTGAWMNESKGHNVTLVVECRGL